MQLGKLQQILDLGATHQVHGIVFLGDFLHSYREGYGLVYDLMGVLKTSKVPLYVVVGNHDLQGFSLDTLSRSPLGVLIQSGVLILLNEDTIINNELVLRGIEYKSLHNDEDYQFKGHPSLLRVVSSHNMIIPMDQAPFTFTHPDTINTDANVVVSGHYHMPFSHTTPKGALFINPGIPIRWTISEAKLEPKVLLLTTSNKMYTIDQLPLSYNKQAFDTETPKEIKAEKKDIQNFIQTLETTTFGMNNIEEDIQKYGSDQNLAPEVITELLRRIKSSRGTHGT